jgi:hypothetical protein
VGGIANFLFACQTKTQHELKFPLLKFSIITYVTIFILALDFSFNLCYCNFEFIVLYSGGYVLAPKLRGGVDKTKKTIMAAVFYSYPSFLIPPKFMQAELAP